MMQSNKFSIVSATILMLLMIAVPSFIQAGPPLKSKAARQIRLRAKQFTPTKGEQPAIPPGLAISAYPAGKSGYYIVQFQGPILQDWKDQVSATGAEILHYIPDFAFKVRMKPVQAQQVEQLESVTWVGLYHPAYKLSPNLKRNGTKVYTVRIERSADVGLARAAIAKSGAKVLAHKRNILKVAADTAQLEAVARVLDVAWVENFMKWEKHNEYAAGTILNSNTANDTGYDGSTQIIGIADTGLGGGTINSSHPHISARVKSIYNWTGGTGGIVDWLLCWYEIIDDGSVDVEIGHGTHVALSALGAGGLSGEGRGTAPGAELIFQSVENFVNYYDPYDPPDDYWCEYDGYRDGYYLTGIPADIGDLFQQAYNDGARIHSNSWGSNAMGAYTVDSANLDDFIWRNRDMTITYSAGNSGRDADGDGVVDSDSMGSPSTAKNVITVGASENDRQDDYTCDQANLTYTSHDSYQPGQTCSDMGGNQSLFLGTWGQRYGSTFPSDPIFSDLTAGNAEQMAAWSSRGRTDDARIKPDVVAPGTWVLSGYSSLYQEGYGDPLNPQTGSYQWDGWGMPSTEWYKYMGGTSMSSPLVAGGAAVVRDFYEKAHGHNASAALVKATLINSAYDLQDENNDGVNDNHFPIPNVHEGWGRVDLVNATDSSHQYVDETDALQTGGEFIYQFSVNSAIKPFKVTLVWSDYPSTAAAWKHLVNNLNLEVTSPVGDNYLGNRFDVIYGWSIIGGLPDKQNNVENVYVQSPTVGTWTVTVKGFNVPNGPQPFALVVDGIDSNNPPQASFTAVPTSGEEPLTVDFDASLSSDPDGDDLTYTWDFGDGSPVDTESGGTANHDYTETGTYTAVLTVADPDGATDTASEVITVTAPGNTAPTANFTAVPTSGEAPLTVDFDATTSSDPDLDPLTYSWDFGDGSPPSDDATASYIYSSGGTYTVVLTVDDGNGAADTASQVITVLELPTASFTYTCNGLSCDFDASDSSDSDGTIVSYDWNFGDGNSGSGVAPSHAYETETAATYNVTLTVTDNHGATDATSAEVQVTPPQPSSGPLLWTTKIWASTDKWEKVTIGNGQDYDNEMVVVCTPNYSISGLGPTVARVRNATDTSFEVGLARPWFGALAGEHWSAWIHCMVVRAGVYTEAEHGVKMEAVRLESFTSTDKYRSWVGEPQTYANTYASPVVVGQVIGSSAVIPGQIGDWSVFWSRGSRRNKPPSSTSFYVGRHTGEDPNGRLPATVGYVVIEAGIGTIEGMGYSAGLGSDSVRGVGNSPPYSYALSGLSTASTAILSQAGMDGGNGGWAILYGSAPLTASQVSLAIEEDWYRDSERRHTSEQVGYIVFE